MLKVEKITIGDLKVTTQKHPYFRGMALKGRWLQFVGPSLSPVLASLARSGVTDLANADMGVMAAALGELFFRMDPAELQPLICETLASTTVVVPDEKGVATQIDLSNPAMIELVFGDRELDSLKTIWFALKVNFAGLFPDGAMAKLVQAMAPKESPST